MKKAKIILARPLNMIRLLYLVHVQSRGCFISRVLFSWLFVSFFWLDYRVLSTYFSGTDYLRLFIKMNRANICHLFYCFLSHNGAVN